MWEVGRTTAPVLSDRRQKTAISRRLLARRAIFNRKVSLRRRTQRNMKYRSRYMLSRDNYLGIAWLPFICYSMGPVPSEGTPEAVRRLSSGA